jgi:hypothetical protein
MDKLLALMFPGGKRSNEAIPATAGNAVYNLSPPSGKRWLVLRGRITLVNDATVANRQIRIEVTDGTNITEVIGRGSAIAGSATGHLSIGELNYQKGVTVGHADDYIGLNPPVLLEDADQLRITIDAGVVGDSYTGHFVVLEL